MVSPCAARAASAFRGRDFAWVRRAPQHTDQLLQLNKTISSIADEARRLPEKHAALLDLFAGVSNAFDEEAYARTLADEALREEFYRALSVSSPRSAAPSIEDTIGRLEQMRSEDNVSH
jgi:hypothetical protein